MLADKGIDYECIEVDKLNPEDREKVVNEIKKMTGKSSFPVFVINDRVIVGYKMQEIKEALSNEV